MRDYIEIIKENLRISEHETLKESVYQAFHRTIILGQIPLGKRINESELSTLLNISRTPIRYALSKLADEQLVEYKQEVGMIVKGLSIKGVHEIFKIRFALETLATVEAMSKMSEKDFTALENILIEGNKYITENRIDELHVSFYKFNAFIFEMSDMPRLHDIVKELKNFVEYFRDISVGSNERRSIALNEHWLIFRGMKNKDVKQIEMIIYEHLTYSLNFIVSEMRRHNIE